MLITLGIVGVVASMTIPSLMADYREKQTVVQLQKVYSTLSQALESVIEKDGEVNYWCSGQPVDMNECSVKIADKFASELKITKRCGANDKTCQAKNGNSYGWKPLHDGTWHMPTINGLAPNDATMIMADGTILMFHAEGSDNSDGWCLNNMSAGLGSIWSAYYGKCAKIYVDINGMKGPNVYGKDLFDFKVFRDGMRASGLQIDTVGANSFVQQCAKGKGADCSGWILVNKNMDYLRCPDKLGWDKASSCKD